MFWCPDMLLLWGHDMFFSFADQTGSVFVFWGQTAASPLVPRNRTSPIPFFFIEHNTAVGLKLKPSRVVFFIPLAFFTSNLSFGFSSSCRQKFDPWNVFKSQWAANWSASLLSLRAAQLQRMPKGETQVLLLQSIGSAIFLAEPLEPGLHQERFAYRTMPLKINIWYLKANACLFLSLPALQAAGWHNLPSKSPPCDWEGDWQGRSLSPMPLSHVGNTFRKCGVEFANHRLFPWQKRELSQPIVSVSSPQRASGWGSRSFSLTYSMTLYVLMPQNGSLLCSSAWATLPWL